MFFGGRKDFEDPEYKEMLNVPKEGPVAGPKPSDVRNGDLVSLLLAATPPYLYNMPMIPHTFFFSEMLRSFVQAKTERQHMKVQQVPRRRKRTWRDASPPKPSIPDLDKPLELTTPRNTEKAPTPPSSPPPKRPVPNVNFTAEKLANSSVPVEANQNHDVSMPTPPMWFPGVYPSQPPYPIDPLHFFIDLRVSAHIWDRKLAADRENLTHQEAESPLNLTEPAEKLDVARHNSAFSVPHGRRASEEICNRSKHSVHYLVNNLKNIYSPEKKRKTSKEEEEELETKQGEDGKNNEEKEDKKEDGEQKNEKNIRAVLGLELVSDFVKQESDTSDGSEEYETD